MLFMNDADYQEVIKNTLRDDDAMAVQLALQIVDSGESAFVIEITEKKPVEIKNRIVFFPPYQIDNLSEAIEAINNDKTRLDHPFGTEWEQYWKLAMRMASSISPYGEIRESIKLAAPEKNDQGITAQIPDCLKSLKTNDNPDRVVYIPTSKKLTQADLKKLSNYPYFIKLESGKIDFPEDVFA